MLKFCKGCKNGDFDLIINMICKLAGRMLIARFETNLADVPHGHRCGFLAVIRLPFFVETLQTALRAACPPLRCGRKLHWLHVFNLTGKLLDGWRIKTKFSIHYSLSAVHNVRKFSNFVDAG